MKNILQLLLGGFCFLSADAMMEERYYDDSSDTYSEISQYHTGKTRIEFQNPCFPEFSKKENIRLTSGATLGFASTGIVGTVIRAACGRNDIKNPLGITHSGIGIVANPWDVYHMVLQLTSEGKANSQHPLSYKAGEAIKKELVGKYRDIIAAISTEGEDIFTGFTLESDGSAGEVLRGIAPHTHIHDFGNRLLEYSGDVYVRNLKKPVPYEQTLSFLKEYLGRPYEKLSTLGELLRAVNSNNEEERTENVFCSELVACFYKHVGLLPMDLNASNIIPEQLSYYAGHNDILRHFAKKDKALKLMRRDWDDSYSEDDIGCLGCMCKSHF